MPRNARWARSKPSLTRTHQTWLSEGPGGQQSARLWDGASGVQPTLASGLGCWLPPSSCEVVPWACLTLPSCLCYSASWPLFSLLACLPQSTPLFGPRHSSAIQGDGSSLLHFQLFPLPLLPSGVLSVHLSVTCCPLSRLVIFSMHHGQSGFDSCFPQTTSAPSFPIAAGSWKQ